jgi:hypothetical protein
MLECIADPIEERLQQSSPWRRGSSNDLNSLVSRLRGNDEITPLPSIVNKIGRRAMSTDISRCALFPCRAIRLV